MFYIKRFKTADTGTFGRMFNETMMQLCYTLERAKTGDHPCIPPGTYTAEPYNSPTKGEVWLLTDVPGRSMIEIHPANLASQLLGCIAPGMTVGQLNGVPAVLGSQAAFALLKSKLPGNFQLTITEEFV